MNSNNLTVSGHAAIKAQNRAGYAHGQPQRMSGEECFARFHQKLKATENRALRNFNRLDDNFKFVVMTLANRFAPGTFRCDEVGRPFEYFEKERRRLLITAMNEITRWGSILPRRFSIHECVISK